MGWRSYTLEAQRSRQAIELAGRHGWAEEPVAGIPYVALGMTMVVQGRLQEAERSLEQAERTLRAEVELAAGMRLRYARGLVDLGSGRPEAALAAFQAAERLAGLLVTEHVMASRLRSHVLQTLVRLGQTQRAEQILAEMSAQERDSGHMRSWPHGQQAWGQNAGAIRRQPIQTRSYARTSPADSSTVNWMNPASPSSAIRSRGSSSRTARLNNLSYGSSQMRAIVRARTSKASCGNPPICRSASPSSQGR